VKVADFGLAISLEKEDDALGCGTPGWISPEQKRSSAADVYALALFLCALLAGQPPPEAVAMTRRLDLPTGLRVLLDRMLEGDPLQRPRIEEVMSTPWFRFARVFFWVMDAPSEADFEAAEDLRQRMVGRALLFLGGETDTIGAMAVEVTIYRDAIYVVIDDGAVVFESIAASLPDQHVVTLPKARAGQQFATWLAEALPVAR
jgi:hypothetical protein